MTNDYCTCETEYGHEYDMPNGEYVAMCDMCGTENGCKYLARWNEPLEWHIEHLGDEIAVMLDENGYPTDKANKAISEWLLKEYGKDIMVSIVDSDEPALLFEAYAESLDQVWDLWALMANCCDPGTYGHGYMFARVASALV